MISLLQKLHAFFYGLNQQNDLKHKCKSIWFVVNVFVRLLERLVYWGILLRGTLFLKPLKNENKLVVSFTSFPARIDKVWMVVDCLLRQTFSPSSIFLYLSKEQFPDGRNSVPKSLLKYEKWGLRIIFVEGDLKSHKKYFYVSQSLTDECFVTIDDDTLYRNDLLERLWRLHERYPNCVCANYGRFVSMDGNVIMPYNEWNVILDEKIHYNEPNTIAIGFGGVLYPSVFYKGNIDVICDARMIKETCLCGDDLWLRTMEFVTNTPVVISSYYANPPTIASTSSSALSVVNRSESLRGNDVQLAALNEKFYLFNFFRNVQ